MPKTHVVKQGEHMSGIAALHGFQNFHAIWDHPKNANLRAIRNPHILFPGDQVFIPDREERIAQIETGRKQLFQASLFSLFLRLRVHDIDDKALANAPFELGLESEDPQDKESGTTDAKAVLTHKISKKVENGELTVQEKRPPLQKGGSDRVETIQYDLKIGHLDPKTRLSGQQARLNNLGYFAGFTVRDFDQFLWAVEEFQCDHMFGKQKVPTRPKFIPESEDPQTVEEKVGTGVADDKTRNSLEKVHDL